MATFGFADFDDGNGSSNDPVSQGETYEVTIEDTGKKGDGIAKIDGLVIFVPGADVGDEVTIKINKVGRRAAFAELVE